MIKIFLLTLIFVMSVFSAHAEDSFMSSDCLDKARVEELNRDFQFVNKDDSKAFSRCDSKSRMYRLMQAVMYLQDLKLESFKNSEFNNNVIDNRPYDFFKARARMIILEPEGGCRKGYLAYVQMGEEERGIIHVCDILNNQALFQVAGAFIHEVRHLDPKGYAHIGCTHGSLMGVSGACDMTYQEGGSYGVSAEFFTKITRSKYTDPVIRQDSRAAAVGVFQNSFNKYPLGLKQGALLKSTDGHFGFYDGEKLRAFPMEASPHSLMVGRLRVPTLFNRDDSSVKSYFFSPRMVDTKGVFAEEFRNKMNYATQKSLVDISYSANYDCKLFEKSLVCETENGKVEKLFTSYKGLGLISSKWSALLKAGTLYLSADDGYLYALPDTFEELQKTAVRDWKKSPGAYNATEISFWDKDTDIILTNQGKIRFYDKGTKAWETSGVLAPYTFESMVAPYIWSEHLQDL